jgi:hypothetical protein
MNLRAGCLGLNGFGQKEGYFSRKGAKTQRKALETGLPLRLCARTFVQTEL